MFDIGFWEIAIIMLIALLILGPERLPRAARTIGLWVGKARRTLADVKRDIDRELDATELKKIQSIKNEIKDDLKEAADVMKDTTDTLNETIEETRETVNVKEQVLKTESQDRQPGAKPPDTEPKAAI